MRILLTGSNGLLGQKITDFLLQRADVTLLCTSRGENRNPEQAGYTFEQLDLEDWEGMQHLIRRFAPTHLIHSAAISSVEACEANPEQTALINVVIPQRLAQLAYEQGIHYSFLSTDFVFDGKQGPYTETDPLGPCNAYGASKVKAEEAILAVNPKAAILRTILVYGVIGDKGRSNLVLWAKSKLEQGEAIKVVADQWRMPTWVDDLAQACISAADRKAEGIFHISGPELYSIIEVVEHVADYWQLDKKLISPIRAAEIGQDNNRPRTTGFILDKAYQELGFQPTSLTASFEQIAIQLKKFQQHA